MNKNKIKEKTLKVSFAVENCQLKVKEHLKKKVADKFPINLKVPQVTLRQQ
jgi:hypothetical protein